ncbi:MAG: nicotinate (nicotinamide) nucleotide adenylyltransferase [Niabella sp.]
MKIGLFFGSFNPIHHAHLIIAKNILNQKLVDKIWFVVSPHNPLKETKSLLNENQRLYLLNLAIEGEADLKASDVEFFLPRPSYTSHTLNYLKEKNPTHEYSVIMGGDSFFNIKKWKNYNYIINNYNILLYNRPGFIVKNDLNAKLTPVNAPLLELSASTIRQLIKEKKSIRYLLPDNVIEEIEKAGYYRK